ncbi:glycosyltransferase [uncultured Lacinutrix sp.]|uniref:glycosyltransferase family 2 protein n=1 Tax=uncultured Lacinutrix sp. TaxID=574032 RepID=UPI0026381198|nr:glycosyltransferase [uncultured Lacinutrix sp.]
MNVECLNSFVKSAKLANKPFEIILVESSNEADYTYNEDVKVLKPNTVFNFHKFANIGLRAAKGDYFIFSNNDVVFDKNCLVEFFKVINNNKNIKSFSPYDARSNKLPKAKINTESHILGFEIQKHITGWCIVMHKDVYKIIKELDERFDFYYADNDYAMQLQKYNIKHALVTKAYVEHLEAQSTLKDVVETNFKLPENTPKYIIEEQWTWVLSNEKMINGLIAFHKKWGSRKLIKMKLFLAKNCSNLGLGYLNRYIV